MSDDSAKIKAMIERTLKKDPKLKSIELQQRAAKIDPAIAELTGRQFHARYVIQVRKKLFAPAGPRKPAARRRVRKAGQGADPFVSLLTESYESKKSALEEAIDDAFRRAIAADSVKQIDSLLASIEERTREFEHA